MFHLMYGSHSVFWKEGNITYMNCPVSYCTHRLKTTHDLDEVYFYVKSPGAVIRGEITYEEQFYIEMAEHLYFHVMEGEILNPDGTLYTEPVNVPVV